MKNFKDLLNHLQEIEESYGVQLIDVVYDGYEVRIKLELSRNYFDFLEEE